MNLKELKNSFFIEMSTSLEKYKMIYFKGIDGFRKNIKNGYVEYSFLFYKYSDKSVQINPLMNIRFDIVESIYHRDSEFSKKEKKNSATIGCSIENYLNDKKELFRNSINASNNDIKNAANFYKELFIEIVQPFFGKFSSLASLDSLINSNPKQNLNLIHPIFRGSKGIIISKLLGRENSDELQEIYYEFYSKYYDGFYLSDFKRVVNTLENNKLFTENG